MEIYPDVKRRGIYLTLFTDPEGNSYFSIYQISWIKMKKSNFLQIKNVTWSTAFLRFCCKFSMKIIFHLPVKNGKSKIVDFLVFVCTTASISSIENISKRDDHLGSGFKSENSQGYSELQEPIKTHEIGITDLVNTNYYCYYLQIACPCGLR